MISYKPTQERVEGLEKAYAALFTSQGITINNLEKGYGILAEQYDLPAWVIKSVINNQTVGKFVGDIAQEVRREALEKGDITPEGLREAMGKMAFEKFRDTTAKRAVGTAYQSPEQNEVKREQGSYWRGIREKTGIETAELEIMLQLEGHSVRDFELGLISYEDIKDGFLKGIAWLLCAEEELAKFKEMYSIQ